MRSVFIADTSSRITLAEGSHVVFLPSCAILPEAMLSLACAASAEFGSKPVRCIGWLPGIWLQTRCQGGADEVVRTLDRCGADVMRAVQFWIDSSETIPQFKFQLTETTELTFSRSCPPSWEPPALMLERRYPWDEWHGADRAQPGR